MNLAILFPFARRWEAWAALASVVAIIAGVTVFAAPADSDGGARSTAADSPAREGDIAPNFIVPTLDGDVFELATVFGKPVWINVWASWCPPCRVEMPDIDEIRQEGEARGLVFVAMNVGEDRSSIESYLANTGYDFTVGVDFDGAFARAYEALGLPMHIFISADGVMASVRVGGMTRLEMKEQVDELVTASAALHPPAE